MPHRAMFDDGFSNPFLDADVIKAHTNHVNDLGDDGDGDILYQDALAQGNAHNNPTGSLSPQDHSFLSAALSSAGRASISGISGSGSAHSPSGNSFSSLSPSTAWSALLPLQNTGAGQGQWQGPMLGGGDEWALGNTFDQGELDMLFFNEKAGGDMVGGDTTAGAQGLNMDMDWLLQPQQGQANDSTFDMLNLDMPTSPTALPHTVSSSMQPQQQQNGNMLDFGQLQMHNQNQQQQQQQQQSVSMAQLDLGGMAGAAAWAQIQAEQMRQAQQLKEIQRQQQMQFLEAQMSAAAAVLKANGRDGLGDGSANATQDGQVPMPSPMSGPKTAEAAVAGNTSATAPSSVAAVGMSEDPSSDAPKETKKRGRPGRKPKQPSPDSPIPEPGPMGGKHNKTERRYRQKVQAAQADLRDAVPALRVLYGTSTAEQRATTDIKLADGSVDGLPEVSRPNASAKATILSGARQYIELLQDRSASLARKVEELEAYRIAVGGAEDCNRWRADFDRKERELQEQREQARSLIRMDNDDDNDNDSEDEAPKKRKKSASSEGTAAARVFAAFAMSFSLVPSASTLLSHHPETDITPGRVLAGSATPTQVIARLPLITAEHVHSLIKRMVPIPIAQALVPSPGAMVDWAWRLLVGVVLMLVLGPILQRWVGKQGDRPKGAGNIVQMSRDLVGVHEEDREEWDKYAGAVAGGHVVPGRLTRAHVLLRMRRTADSAYPLALLALLQPRVRLPFTRTPDAIWQSARAHLQPSDPEALRSVLQLPYEEAKDALMLVPPTRTPLTAIAEQIALVHLSDLYSAQFVQLVQQTTATPTMQGMSRSLAFDMGHINIPGNNDNIEAELRHILRSSARGTPSHALALVLVGISSFTSNRSSPAAQAALASSLAGEEMRGAPSSVRAMLELLYPGFAAHGEEKLEVSETALALDGVARACIAYIGLLVKYRTISAVKGSTSGSDGKYAGMSRKERQEVSRYVAKTAGQIRVLLSKAHCVSARTRQAGARPAQDQDEVEQGELEDAKEKLVEVLATLGRRASSRAMGRDEDSGLEGDFDEL